MFIKDERTRKYIYGIIGSLGLIALGYGLITDTQLVLWMGLAGSILGNGLSFANTKNGKHEA